MVWKSTCRLPWAAAGSAYAQRADCWLGIISDVVEKDNALDSEYTIEDPGDPDDAVVVSGAQLAGLEGFGNHDARIECAEIDDEVADPTPILVDSSGAPAAAPKPRGRPKGSKNKPKDGSARAAARAEADADGIDPLGAFCDELDGEGATPKSTGAKLRQGWEYTEYTEELDNPRLQPERVWGGITHPRLRRRSYDAANGKLGAIDTHDATFPPAAFEWMHRQLILYALGDEQHGGTRKPFDWQRRTGQPAPSLGELIAWYATTKIMLLSRCSVLKEYWDDDAESNNKQIAGLFSYHRWNAILQNLHFADRAADFPCDESGVPYHKCPVDKRNWDIQGFQDLLTSAWRIAADYTSSLGMDEKAYKTIIRPSRDGWRASSATQPSRRATSSRALPSPRPTRPSAAIPTTSKCMAARVMAATVRTALRCPT